MSKELKRVAALSMVAGSIGPLLLFIFVIIGHDPWYAPQYIVPITGMLVGNAMTGVSLGANTFLNNMKSQRGQIEGALMLGATPKEAAASLIRDAFDSAILPTINSMVGMGIISLPGMMTGQILSVYHHSQPFNIKSPSYSVFLEVLPLLSLSFTAWI